MKTTTNFVFKSPLAPSPLERAGVRSGFRGLLFLLLFISFSASAIVPELMSYQVVVRNASNALLANTSVGVQVSILPTSAVGIPVYVERQTVTTNLNGLATLQIGAGTVQSGTFSTIDWGTGAYWIKTEIDPAGGTTYSITSNTQMLTTPYAMHAKSADITSNNADLTGAVTSVGNATALGSFTSANLLSAVSDETGTGAAVFATAPTFTTNITTPLLIGGTGATDKITYKSTTGTGTTTAIAHQFIGGTNGATVAATILNNGNVGIGTAAPEPFANLTLAGGEGASGGVALWADEGDDDANKWLFYAGTDGKFYFADKSTGSYVDNILIDGSTGNVGIGTATPSSLLQVRSVSESRPGGVSAAAISVLKLSREGTSMHAWNESAEFRVGHGGPSVFGTDISLYVNGASNQNDIPDQHAMTWAYTGNVGIGTTTPTTKLEVNGTENTNIFKVGAGGNGIVMQANTASNDIVSTTSAGAARLLYIRQSGSTTGISLTATNNVGIGRIATTNILEIAGAASQTTAGAWLANSDRRIKTNILDIDNSFETILHLRPVKFKYTDEWKTKHPTIKDRYYYNFIAQEYQTVFPDAVKESGEYIDGDSKQVLQIDTYDAQIVTIKAVQELIKQNKELQAQIDELKKMVEGLVKK